ncbi:DMT family transporter [Glaciimonas sp. PCH181]|uniref:DMT family transporter n=1 Tax=Glaciimonas sp. PCH181 TaxID=2133943 RepID=UPI000D37CEF5|nr:EamA family transporter [Glaciimonas sp. PCH181]PUA17687.1 EamA family transporter [Glaciimonas sp. PCH181]
MSTPFKAPANRLATVAILLSVLIWAAQASLAVALHNIPPFLLTGLTLSIGGALSLPKIRHWKLSLRPLAIGIYGIFVYHVFYFMALQNAPAIEANLVHYLWPALIVVMTPLFSPAKRVHWNHVAGMLCGIAGVVVAVISGVGVNVDGFSSGYVYALFAAFVWATYSLLLGASKGQTVWTTGGVCLVSGILALLCHVVLEPTVNISNHDWMLVVIKGLGPMGLAFYLWDYGMRHGDSRLIGLFSYAIPVLSTLSLSLVTGRPLTIAIVAATGLVVVGGLFGFISTKTKKSAIPA